MNNYSPEQLLEFWDKGVPLLEAISRFCNVQDLPEFYRTSLTPPENKNDLITAIATATYAASKHYLQRDQLFKNLFAQLSAGSLIGIGYEMPTKTSDYPIVIPRRLWPPDEGNPGKSSISVKGLQFVDIRIIAKENMLPARSVENIPAKMLKINNPAPKFEIEIKKRGPQSREEMILDAYEALKNSGQINYDASQASHIPAIREMVLHLYPELNGSRGLSDEAIRNKFAARFNSEKHDQNNDQN